MYTPNRCKVEFRLSVKDPIYPSEAHTCPTGTPDSLFYTVRYLLSEKSGEVPRGDMRQWGRRLSDSLCVFV